MRVPSTILLILAFCLVLSACRPDAFPEERNTTTTATATDGMTTALSGTTTSAAATQPTAGVSTPTMAAGTTAVTTAKQDPGERAEWLNVLDELSRMLETLEDVAPEDLIIGE